MSDIVGRYADLQRKITAATVRSSRHPSEVRVLAVSKRQSVDTIAQAYRAGICHFGENYAQELTRKRNELSDLRDIEWHFVGKLQRNKAKAVAGHVALIHAVDREELVVEIDKIASRRGVVQPLLLAVNIAKEASKSGVPADQAARWLARTETLSHVQVVGLMCMPPLIGSENGWARHPSGGASQGPPGTEPAGEQNRRHFRALRKLRDELATDRNPLAELSMGTTADFEVAIEEGATWVRIGTGLLGPRERA